MNQNVIRVLTIVSVALAVVAIYTKSKEGMFLFFTGVAVLLCTWAIVWLRAMRTTENPAPSNTWAIGGAALGLLFGGFVGVKMGLGQFMIILLSSDAPEQDFGTLFGAIGGGIVGAFALAIAAGAIGLKMDFPKRSESSSDN